VQLRLKKDMEFKNYTIMQVYDKLQSEITKHVEQQGCLPKQDESSHDRVQRLLKAKTTQDNVSEQYVAMNNALDSGSTTDNVPPSDTSGLCKV